jgi:hypothetical protein
MQNFHNLLYREGEREMISFCNDQNLEQLVSSFGPPFQDACLHIPLT